MPECQHCGAFVSESYARVFTPEEVEQPRACPNCPDRKRGADGRAQAKKTRQRSG
jgi:hypothetical protein